MAISKESSRDSFKNTLLQNAEHFSFDEEIRAIAEQVRQQAIEEIKDNGEKCDEKQKLASSIEVVPGVKRGEYLVVSAGEYGKDLEFGTRNSLESPWFTPAFVTVVGSIHNCLQRALKRALLKARRPHVRR